MGAYAHGDGSQLAPFILNPQKKAKARLKLSKMKGHTSELTSDMWPSWPFLDMK